MSNRGQPTYPPPRPEASEVEDEDEIDDPRFDQLQAITKAYTYKLMEITNKLSSLESTLGNLTSFLERINLNKPENQQSMEGVQLQIPRPGLSRASSPIGDLVSNTALKELSKKVYKFPMQAKLAGPDNYDLWQQSLYIMFRGLGLLNLFDDLNNLKTLNDSDQAIILMLIKDSVTKGPKASISWYNDTYSAITILLNNYSLSSDLQQDSLTRKLYSIKFSNYKGSLTEFNAEFNNILNRLKLAKVDIPNIDQVNRYFQALEGSFPFWAERMRSNIRQAKALGQSTDKINLQYLMNDIVEENRIPASSIAKKMVHHIKDQNKAEPNKFNNKHTVRAAKYTSPCVSWMFWLVSNSDLRASFTFLTML